MDRQGVNTVHYPGPVLFTRCLPKLLILLVLVMLGCRSGSDRGAGLNGATDASVGPLPGYGDPTRYEQAVARYEAQDAASPPPKGAVVCVGSSSMRLWADRIGEDLQPLTVVPRGFGGSNMNDLLHYLDSLVLVHEPRAVVIYEGDNDVHQGVEPAVVGEALRRVVAGIHARLPECRVYVLSIKPSPKRWHLKAQMIAANRAMRAVCGSDDRLTYIDVFGPMLGGDGRPRPELYVKDRLHLSGVGYDVWRDVVGPVVVGAEAGYESAGR